MYKAIHKSILRLFQGDALSVTVKKNIAFSVLLKGLSVLISFTLVPMTLNYLNIVEYGIWLTLSSILTWINFFDIGLGNGLRNKLTEALTDNDLEKARIYVSTTFALLIVLMTTIFTIFNFINPLLNWAEILNTPPEMAEGLSSVVLIVFTFFCLQFVFKAVGIVFVAHQKMAVRDLMGVLGSALSLLIIYLLTQFTHGSLYYVAFTFSLAPVVVFIAAYFFVFFFRYKHLRPSLKHVRFGYSKDLLGLGIKFFIIQVACLLVYTTSNIIITQVLGPEEVTVYNIAFKYFSVITMAFAIVLGPMWSAYTEAWRKSDIAWIKRALRRNIQIWSIFLVGTTAMVFGAGWVYQHWVGPDIVVPIGLSIGCAIYVSISTWNNIFAMFLNGVGKVTLLMYVNILVSIVYVPMTVFLTSRFGTSGAIFSMSLVLLTGTIIAPIQYFKLISKRATGLWNS